MTEGTLPGLFSIPPGTFRIDREGFWRHEGQEVTHPGVLQNLYANLRVDPGGHYLQVGPVRITVAVEDAPFVVVRVEAEPPGSPHPESLRIHLNDGTQELLGLESLWVGPDRTPYCRVKLRRFTARLALPAWLQLTQFVEERETGDLTVVLGGRRVPIADRFLETAGGSSVPLTDGPLAPGC